ncbi:unnamed protein product [Oikopleura dioica]|uniref:Membralin n=1 Tax=Oikopleura dioica TaxID=34765 RepID=E4XMX8_OIKDI|nr:unnamed protein product [Oikopleura dioica]
MTDDGIGESNTVHEEAHPPETDDGSIAEEIEVEPEPAPEPVRQPRRRGPTPTRGATGDVILQVHIANIFLSFCQRYARLCKKGLRRFLEFIVLIKALGAALALIYSHVGYQNSSTCLLPLKGKIPVESILRVEIGRRRSALISDYLYRIDNQCPLHRELEHQPFQNISRRLISVPTNVITDNSYPSFRQFHYQPNIFSMRHIFDFGFEYTNLVRFEFSHEYGYLRLSEQARKTRNVEVIKVTLDPSKDDCFKSLVWDKFGRVLLAEWFGYDWIILDSIVQISGNTGYIRNTVTKDQFTVFNGSQKKRLLYVPIIACMVFTALIAMLLRFAYKQVFMFVFRVLTEGPLDLQARRIVFASINLTVHNHFPYGAVASSVLALIGLEDIMSEYFGDSRIAFYVILSVWIADQFHSYCCHTPITKKYWIRFFYLYHLGFYMYYHIYNSRRNAFIALFTSCMLTMHMMIFFFHHFELPFVLNTFQIRRRFTPLIAEPIINPATTSPNQESGTNLNEDQSLEIEADVHPHDENETDLEIEEMETLQEDDFQVEIHISDMEEDIEELRASEL